MGFPPCFGDTVDLIEAEERRLFYVATTRAKESLALLTETQVQSPYLTDLAQHVHVTPLSWNKLPPVPSLDAPRLEIRVFNAYEVREQVKTLGYRWHPTGRHWHRAVAAEAFSLEALVEQPWAKHGVTIEIYSETGQLSEQHSSRHVEVVSSPTIG